MTTETTLDAQTMAAWAAQTEDSLYAVARNAATTALEAYNPDSDRLPFPEPGMYGDDLKWAIGGAGCELADLEFSWKDGYCGSPEFRRAKSVLHWAWLLTANARTWAGRTDAGGLIDTWVNLEINRMNIAGGSPVSAYRRSTQGARCEYHDQMAGAN
jgi:hypothetical protein